LQQTLQQTLRWCHVLIVCAACEAREGTFFTVSEHAMLCACCYDLREQMSARSLIARLYVATREGQAEDVRRYEGALEWIRLANEARSVDGDEEDEDG
jgi:hypothetical protein